MSIMKRRDFIWLISATALFGSLIIGPVSAHRGEDDGDKKEEGPVDLRAKNLVLAKVYCLLIFFSTFIPGILPYFFRKNNAFLVLGTQYAGGVFLATSMIHFLGDANKTFEDLTSKTYSFAFMLACCGYLLTAVADVVMVTVLHRHINRTADVETGKDGAKPAERDQAEAQHFVEVIPPLADAFVLILALCFHSIFDGIEVGVSANAHDAWRGLWTISIHKVFLAIALGIALLRVLPNWPLLSIAAYAFAFAISSPVGVAIGMIIDSTSEGRTADWIYAITMGIATGIFIYISINHLLAKGFTPPDNKKVSADTPLYRLLAFALGLAVIFVVLIWD
ncbi:hypothetical protein R1sor_000141 [Riccia sorocarpa]|uniref:Zinc transporter n=1 Tax=Riccia sorocarpa TaxID=122646 RepID=A0ABD3GW92_9MARC